VALVALSPTLLCRAVSLSGQLLHLQLRLVLITDSTGFTALCFSSLLTEQRRPAEPLLKICTSWGPVLGTKKALDFLTIRMGLHSLALDVVMVHHRKATLLHKWWLTANMLEMASLSL
jgi:hypothetical protein